jgi:hypothetical protein
MGRRGHNSTVIAPGGYGNLSTEANTGLPLTGAFERMARRRFQDPTPVRRGQWWTIQVRQDVFTGDQRRRSNRRVRLAAASMPEREVKKLAAEYLRPINQGLESIGSATNFTHYVENTYKPVMMPLMAKTTQDRYQSVITNYLVPTFGKLCLRDLTPLTLQRYFCGLSASTLAHESKDKIRDVLSGILGSRNRECPFLKSGTNLIKKNLIPTNLIPTNRNLWKAGWREI